MYTKYKNKLKDLKDQYLLRDIKKINKDGKYIYYDQKKYLNLNSNDYLGIANNREIIKNFFNDFSESIIKYTFGSASSRLLTGSDIIFNKLENLIKNKYKANKNSDVILFNSGYHANLGIYSTLLSKKDVLFCDKLNHASIIDGLRLSGAKMFRYKHINYKSLEEMLKKHRNKYETAIISSESVFSMDGDICSLDKLIELKKRYNCILIIDEAHSFGVFGEDGFGICNREEFINEVDLIMATFGKAIGSYGAFCYGKKILIDYLKNQSRPFIFSTMIPPISALFSYYIIDKVLPEMNNQRLNMFKTIKKFTQCLDKRNITITSKSQIVPIIIGSNNQTINLSNKLMENGYFILPIRHPTVPLNTSRIRLSFRADIEFSDVKNIINLI